MTNYELRMDIITCVEEERAIWDISHDSYRVTESKNTAWMEVMRKLQAKKHSCEMVEAKRIWKTLRDTWKKNTTAKTGSAAERPWLPRLSNYTADGASSTFACSSQDKENVMDVDEEVTVVSPPSSSDGSAEQEQRTVTRSPSRSPSRKILGTPKMKKKRAVLQENYNFLREAADAVKARLTMEAPAQQPPDKFGPFGTFVTSYLREMPEDVATAKMKAITNILFEPVMYVEELP
ncbi:hypothetical protein Y032_0713g1754 [Ancylostoma ceylanicum]|uniref:MADF domain-containing protein n=1 Tax=Ancylostoma ceylanicum TaxID=53326 RepID=A0A016WFW5_9BILA|nr:hypothetical protein Y032_0713g1754 [Ancylostoma ceylanicum]